MSLRPELSGEFGVKIHLTFIVTNGGHICNKKNTKESIWMLLKNSSEE